MDSSSIFKRLRKESPDSDLQTVMRLAEKEMIRQGPKSRAFYRVQATRQLVGAGDVVDKYNKQQTARRASMFEENIAKKEKKTQIELYFEPAHYTCLENVGTVYLTVVCDRGDVQIPCHVLVDYETVDGTAKAGSDYETTKGTLTFRRMTDDNEVNVVGVNIVDNDLYEEDEHFFVHLSNPRAESTTKRKNFSIPTALRAPYSATIMIVDNDHAGCFEFQHDQVEVVEDAGTVHLPVIRTRGARGEVQIPFSCKDGTATDARDYQMVQKNLIFRNDETSKDVMVPILNTNQYEKEDHFYVQLFEPIWNRPEEQKGKDAVATLKDLQQAELGKAQLGKNQVCKVIIRENKELKGYVDKVATDSTSSSLLGSSSWTQQFKDATTLEAEDDTEPSILSKFIHYLALPWKVLFALVPPTDYFGGWACFVASIAVIGMMTALIGDLASHFGCTVGLKDSVTAITLVAVGTSLPDTFASKVAATGDEYADNSIGNVTGSNAVNVFLGIGLAWMVAAIYNNAQNKPFTVEPGELGLSVTVFLVGAVICLAILTFRRKASFIGAELGGPFTWKSMTLAILFLVWLMYVLICSLVAYCHIEGF